MTDTIKPNRAGGNDEEATNKAMKDGILLYGDNLEKGFIE